LRNRIQKNKATTRRKLCNSFIAWRTCWSRKTRYEPRQATKTSAIIATY
jgi:hypothetical protein